MGRTLLVAGDNFGDHCASPRLSQRTCGDQHEPIINTYCDSSTLQNILSPLSVGDTPTVTSAHATRVGEGSSS